MNEPTATLEPPPAFTPPDANEPSSLVDAFDSKFNPSPEPTPVAPPAAAPAPEPVVAEPVAPVVTAPEPAKPEIVDDGDLPTRPKKATPAAPATEKPKPSFDPHKAAPPELRKAYESAKSERDALEKRAKELEEKLNSVPKFDESKIRQEYEAKLKEANENYAKTQEALRYHDYSKTDEYKQKYEMPWNEANDRVKADLEGVMVLDGEVERQATLGDVGELLGMNTVQASRRAKELFGEAAPVFMQHRQELIRLRQAAQKAQSEWREKGSQLQTQEQEMVNKHRERVTNIYTAEKSRLEKEKPDLFADDPTDPDGNKWLRKLDSTIELAWNRNVPTGITDEQRSEMITKAQATMEMYARAFPREVYRTNKLRAQVEELQEKLKGYENSEPAPGNVIVDGKVNPADKPLDDRFEEFIATQRR